MDLNALHAYLAAHRDAHLEAALRLVRQPSISATGEGVRECTALVADLMHQCGIEPEIIETAGQPVVYGERSEDPGAFTILIYGHYDVQPPEPLDAWVTPPFAPVVRDGRIIGRGIADNKGQFAANLLAVGALLKTVGRLPVNVKFLIEGEEESSSPNLPGVVERHREKFRADLVYTADGPREPGGRPTITFGVRGILYVELNCRGAGFDLHSGNRGGAAPNPAWDLVHLLGTMQAPAGRILIEGLYDRMRPLTPFEEDLLARLPYDPAEAGKAMGMAPLGMDGRTYYRRTLLEPTLNVAGFTSGYGGEGAKTIVPAQANVKIDMRLVPDQDPAEVYAAFCRHVQKHAPHVEVRHLGAMAPSRTDGSRPECQAVVRALAAGTGTEPVVYPGLGGSLPDYVWTRILRAPSVVVPYGNPDQANHAPNENLLVENFHAGIRTMVAVLAELGRLPR